MTGRPLRLAVQIALLLALLATGAFLVVRPYVSDQEDLFKQGRINQVISKGPVTVGHVEYKLDSLQAYTRLVDDEGEEISMGSPAGSVIMVAKLTVTPHQGVYLRNKGFSCKAVLRDDRGNTWDSQQPYGFPLPTYCSDSDHPFALDKPGQIAQVYVVPQSAVPHLTGLVVDDLEERNRVLITQ